MADLNGSIKKLIQALNSKGEMLMMNKKQFMGREGRPHNVFSVTKAEWDGDKNKYKSIEIYKSTSLIRVALFLRDRWFSINGWELPTDNEMWNRIREAENHG